MDRLTCRDADGNVHHQWEFNGVNGSYDILDEELLGKQIDRLAAYEDTGLEPEEIYEVRFLIAAQRDPQKLARLRELVLADQEGRLVVLPCKVGDRVWYITSSTEICEAEVIGIWLNVYTNPQMWLEIKYHSKFTGECEHKSRIDLMLGKTVFLTREEAEAALAGKGGEG